MKGNKMNSKSYLLIGGAITIVVLLLIMTNINSTSSKKMLKKNVTNTDETDNDGSTTKKNESVEQTDANESETQSSTLSAEVESKEETENSLDDDTKKELENLAESYYLTLAESNSDEKREGIEAYQDITSYIKPGLIDDTYVIFSSYNMKFENIETLAPGMSVVYVGKGVGENYSIIKDTKDEELNDYINLLLQEEDMVRLTDEVNTSLEKAMKDDTTLKDFIQKVEKAE
jgi:hypothetical protein